MLLYIHGFNSSPLSEKGLVTAQFMADHYPDVIFYQPQLPSDPSEGMALLSSIVESSLAIGENLAFIGSSLGGYYATYLTEHYGGKGVLINPAVKPFELFDAFIGPQYNQYTDEHYPVTLKHKGDVKKFNTEVILHPDRFFVLLQSGDEVLDYRQAVQKYHCCQILLEADGDHSFVNYGDKLPRICQFLLFDN